MEEGEEAQRGPMSWPRAPPKGFAREARAVAVMRLVSLNQRAL